MRNFDHGKNGQLLLQRIFSFISFFSYYKFYFISWMQSIDVQQMVCEPLMYSEFCSKKNMMKYLLVGSSLCMIVASDNLGLLVLHAAFPGEKPAADFLTYVEEGDITTKISLGMRIFNSIKMIVFKTIYSISICKLAFLTKKRQKKTCTGAYSCLYYCPSSWS